jgi:hypothetical protein
MVEGNKGAPGNPVIGPKRGLDIAQILEKEREALAGSGGRSADMYKKTLRMLRKKAAEGNKTALDNLIDLERRLGL